MSACILCARRVIKTIWWRNARSVQYTAVYCSILQYTEMFLIFFLIFLVTCGCWGVAGLADEKDENRLYAHVLDHHARSRSQHTLVSGPPCISRATRSSRLCYILAICYIDAAPLDSSVNSHPHLILDSRLSLL